MRFFEEINRLMLNIEVQDHIMIKKALEEVANSEEEQELLTSMNNLSEILEKYVMDVRNLVENIKNPMLHLAHDTLKEGK